MRTWIRDYQNIFHQDTLGGHEQRFRKLFSLVDAVREDDVKLRIVVSDPSTLIWSCAVVGGVQGVLCACTNYWSVHRTHWELVWRRPGHKQQECGWRTNTIAVQILQSEKSAKLYWLSMSENMCEITEINQCWEQERLECDCVNFNHLTLQLVTLVMM